MYVILYQQLHYWVRCRCDSYIVTGRRADGRLLSSTWRPGVGHSIYGVALTAYRATHVATLQGMARTPALWATGKLSRCPFSIYGFAIDSPHSKLRGITSLPLCSADKSQDTSVCHHPTLQEAGDGFEPETFGVMRTIPPNLTPFKDKKWKLAELMERPKGSIRVMLREWVGMWKMRIGLSIPHGFSALILP